LKPHGVGKALNNGSTACLAMNSSGPTAIKPVIAIFPTRPSWQDTTCRTNPALNLGYLTGIRLKFRS
jgi:hypothetical protein